MLSRQAQRKGGTGPDPESVQEEADIHNKNKNSYSCYHTQRLPQANKFFHRRDRDIEKAGAISGEFG
jgi:hypothetical protein